MTQTCETCRWWEPDTKAPKLMGGCLSPHQAAPEGLALLRFAEITCGEHTPKEPTP